MSSQLRVDKVLPVDGAPTGGGGGIIQVVSTTFTGTWSGSSGSNTFDTVTDLNTTITPKFNTSKIFIMLFIGQWDSSGSNQRGGIRLLRDSTAICVGDAGSNRTRVSGTVVGSNANTDTNGGFHINFLDSPATTSAVTYKVQSMTEGSYTTYVNRSASDADSSSVTRGASTLTLMEVSA
jgi:hypothetical protein